MDLNIAAASISSQTFFEGVEEHRKRLAKDEDVQFQSGCSITDLRRLVRQYPPKEVCRGRSLDPETTRSLSRHCSLQVKQGLETLYKKIQKHLSENSSLMQVRTPPVREEGKID
jgi:hypothetical protein